MHTPYGQTCTSYTPKGSKVLLWGIPAQIIIVISNIEIETLHSTILLYRYFGPFGTIGCNVFGGYARAWPTARDGGPNGLLCAALGLGLSESSPGSRIGYIMNLHLHVCLGGFLM